MQPRLTPKAPQWVVVPKPKPDARLRLVCLPFAGGGALSYWRWPAGLPEDVELWALQLPGREGRINEPAYNRMDALVDALADVLPPLLDTPFVLFGHSMGALIAFELARKLRRDGAVQPKGLFVSGCWGPQLPRKHFFHKLPEKELLAGLSQLGGTPAAVMNFPEILALMIPTIRADLELSETYVYEPGEPLHCSIYAVGGAADALVSDSDLNAWQHETTDTTIVRTFPGGHFYYLDAPGPLLSFLSDELSALK